MDSCLCFYTIRKTDGSDEEFSHFNKRTKKPVFVIQSPDSKCYLDIDDAERELESILEVEPTLPIEIGAWTRA